MYEYLCTKVNLIETKKKGLYVSNKCPFTGYISKKGRPFRYNSILGVVKCYCCGGGAKEIYWLKLQIENNVKFQIKKLKTDYFTKVIYKERYKEYLDHRIQEIKDKAVEKEEVIVKSTDYSLPF